MMCMVAKDEYLSGRRLQDVWSVRGNLSFDALLSLNLQSCPVGH